MMMGQIWSQKMRIFLQYKIGQLFMIAKHSHEQSEAGEGVEVIHNVPHSDPVHGQGRYTEKRIYLSKWAL